MKIARSKRNPEIIFRDSYNFVSQKLDSLVKAFNLPISAKQYFPHKFNQEVNYTRPLDTLPPKSTYFYKQMKPEDKNKFENWYHTNYNTPFVLTEKLAEYCENDVNILLYALIELQKTFKDISKREGQHDGMFLLNQ